MAKTITSKSNPEVSITIYARVNYGVSGAGYFYHSTDNPDLTYTPAEVPEATRLEMMEALSLHVGPTY